LYNQCASLRCPALITTGKWCPLHKPKDVRPYDPKNLGQHQYYLTRIHRQWREAVLRADPLCKRCLEKGILTPSTVAHHKDHNWRNINLNNGEGLCSGCHTPTTHKKEINSKGKFASV